jgi:hypothetical protein
VAPFSRDGPHIGALQVLVPMARQYKVQHRYARDGGGGFGPHLPVAHHIIGAPHELPFQFWKI